jgi:hypothetical protein
VQSRKEKAFTINSIISIGMISCSRKKRRGPTKEVDVFAFAGILSEGQVNKMEVVATKVKDHLKQVIAISKPGPVNQ